VSASSLLPVAESATAPQGQKLANDACLLRTRLPLLFIHRGALPDVEGDEASPPPQPAPGLPPAAAAAAAAATEESLLAGEEGFSPLEEWSSEDLSRFVARLGTDSLYQRAAARIFHFGLDGLTLMVRVPRKHRLHERVSVNIVRGGTCEKVKVDATEM